VSEARTGPVYEVESGQDASNLFRPAEGQSIASFLQVNVPQKFSPELEAEIRRLAREEAERVVRRVLGEAIRALGPHTITIRQSVLTDSLES
jgi:hypothetical protein